MRGSLYPEPGLLISGQQQSAPSTLSTMAPTLPQSLPADAEDQTYVTISALESGQLTLPERLFVTDADPEKRATVPSLSFLIRHPSPGARGGDTTNLVFDLGVKRDVTKYMPAMQSHINNRQPTIHHPDTADSLRAGGLDPVKDIDIVMLSHVHVSGAPLKIPGELGQEPPNIKFYSGITSARPKTSPTRNSW
jgi:hypothetical protein